MAPDVVGAGVRPVLHHQADRPGHRPRPVDDLRLRPAVATAMSGSTARPGEGTTVELYLPRFRGDVEEDDATAGRRPAERGAGETVLVVEDEDCGARLLVVRGAARPGIPGRSRRRRPRGALGLLQSTRAHRSADHRHRPSRPERPAAGATAARGIAPDLKILFMTGYAENAAVAARLLRARHGDDHQAVRHGGPGGEDPRGHRGALAEPDDGPAERHQALDPAGAQRPKGRPIDAVSSRSTGTWTTMA